jgi:anaerobic selenocysteine-containing dehydrogenase
MRAQVTDQVHPEVVVVPGGWSEANANLLTEDQTLDPISGFPSFRSAVCRIEPA